MERLTRGFVLGHRYRLSRVLATGGMGAVWEAHDDLLERDVAIKLMHPHTASERVFASRFRDEALYSAKLTSPNIVSVYDYGDEGGLAYLVMELVEGRTAAQLLAAEGPQNHETVRKLLAQVASALAVAHDRGIIHRDVKPSNILITPDGTAKLGDFGIARAVDGISYTQAGEVLGTPQYLSPEQARGEPASPASDLYSLGVVGHELLTGSKPFDRGTPLATALAHLNEPPPPLPVTVPEPLAAALASCLAKSPAERPASAHDLAALLNKTAPVAASPIAASPAAAAAPTASRTPASSVRASSVPASSVPAPDTAALALGRRRQLLLAVAATVLVVLLCLAAIFL